MHEIISSVIVPFSVNLMALSIKFVIELQGFLYMNSASLEVFLFGRNSFQRVSVCREKTVNEKTSIEVKGDTGRDSGTYDPVRRDE